MGDVAARPIPVTGSGAAFANAGVYRGFAFRNTSATVAATVRLWDNASAASGTLLDAIELTAGESRSEWLAEQGLWFVNGLYVEVAAGAVQGSVRLG